MIEVITYADFILRIPSAAQHEEKVKELLLSHKQKGMKVQDIAVIGGPQKNIRNGTIESRVYCKLLLNLPETDSKKKVDQYVDDIVPFLQRHLQNCNKVEGIKIVQMKRILDNPNIKEHSVKFD